MDLSGSWLCGVWVLIDHWPSLWMLIVMVFATVISVSFLLCRVLRWLLLCVFRVLFFVLFLGLLAGSGTCVGPGCLCVSCFVFFLVGPADRSRRDRAVLSPASVRLITRPDGGTVAPQEGPAKGRRTCGRMASDRYDSSGTRSKHVSAVAWEGEVGYDQTRASEMSPSVAATVPTVRFMIVCAY